MSSGIPEESKFAISENELLIVTLLFSFESSCFHSYCTIFPSIPLLSVPSKNTFSLGFTIKSSPALAIGGRTCWNSDENSDVVPSDVTAVAVTIGFF